MTDLLSSGTLMVAIAYFAGVFLAIAPIHFIVGLSWKLVEVEAISDEPYNALTIHAILRRYVWEGDLVGGVERILYVTALLLERPEFIAIWLTLKTVARSPRWTQEERIKGRGLFNVFLVGNGLSILLSLVGVAFAILIAGSPWQRDCAAAAILLVSVVALSILTSLWLWWRLEKKWDHVAPKVSAEAYRKIRGKPHPSKAGFPPA